MITTNAAHVTHDSFLTEAPKRRLRPPRVSQHPQLRPCLPPASWRALAVVSCRYTFIFISYLSYALSHCQSPYSPRPPSLRTTGRIRGLLELNPDVSDRRPPRGHSPSLLLCLIGLPFGVQSATSWDSCCPCVMLVLSWPLMFPHHTPKCSCVRKMPACHCSF
jgi:hypothetical protein